MCSEGSSLPLHYFSSILYVLYVRLFAWLSCGVFSRLVIRDVISALNIVFIIELIASCSLFRVHSVYAPEEDRKVEMHCAID